MMWTVDTIVPFLGLIGSQAINVMSCFLQSILVSLYIVLYGTVGGGGGVLT